MAALHRPVDLSEAVDRLVRDACRDDHVRTLRVLEGERAVAALRASVPDVFHPLLERWVGVLRSLRGERGEERGDRHSQRDRDDPGHELAGRLAFEYGVDLDVGAGSPEASSRAAISCGAASASVTTASI